MNIIRLILSPRLVNLLEYFVLEMRHIFCSLYSDFLDSKVVMTIVGGEVKFEN